MLTFFKSKPLLKDLIPTGYVDIHSHILFGIDDGAKTLDDSNFLMQSLSEIGFSKCITTPHTTPYVWDNTREGILAKHQEVMQQSPALSSALQLEVASEYMMDENFVERFQTSPLLTLKDKLVLVEMSYQNAPMALYDILFQLQVAGYQPVLAHPERYAFYHHNLAEYEKLKNAGCYFQLNVLSTVGYYGPFVMEVANQLLQKGLIDFTGSDVHHKNHIAAFSEKVKIKNVDALEAALNNNIKTFSKPKG